MTAVLPAFSLRVLSATKNWARFLIFTASFLALIIPIIDGPPPSEEFLECAATSPLMSASLNDRRTCNFRRVNNNFPEKTLLIAT